MNDKKRLCLQCAYSHWPKHSGGECNAPGGEPVPIREARSDTGMCGPNAVFFEDNILHNMGYNENLEQIGKKI